MNGGSQQSWIWFLKRINLNFKFRNFLNLSDPNTWVINAVVWIQFSGSFNQKPASRQRSKRVWLRSRRGSISELVKLEVELITACTAVTFVAAVAHLSSCHWTVSDANYWTIRALFSEVLHVCRISTRLKVCSVSTFMWNCGFLPVEFAAGSKEAAACKRNDADHRHINSLRFGIIQKSNCDVLTFAGKRFNA